ncbi:hypothetical protein ACFC1R_30860 [Kitasatospora sp. NPDC056138]|uniref:hypothetical protein n=1 Tax=Kitasatospora sp. NPDC056138 TaxID=3345724 RepID=UPI0035D5E578
MSPLTTRRATTVRTLAGTVLAAALIVPTATACSSTSDAHGTTAATAPAATTPTAPDAQGTAAPATTTGAHSTTAPAAPPTSPTSPRATAPAATAKPKSPVRTQSLVDGSTAEVQEVGAQHYVAKIVHNGDVLATLETNDSDAGLDANDMFVVLSLDGQVHSWMGGGNQGPGTFKLAGGWTAKVTKIGDLRYRAQIIGNDNSVDGTLESNQHDAGGVANGVYIVLTAGGEISAHL